MIIFIQSTNFIGSFSVCIKYFVTLMFKRYKLL